MNIDLINGLMIFQIGSNIEMLCMGSVVKCDPKHEGTKGIDDQFTHPWCVATLQTH